MIFKPMNYAPKELLKLWEEREVNFYSFLPSNQKNITFSEFDGGYILKAPAPHASLFMFLGKIKNFGELENLNGGCRFILDGPKNNLNSPMHLIDFKMLWDEKRLHKFIVKNSTKRRVIEDEITIQHFTNVEDVPINEFLQLIEIWKTKTQDSLRNATKHIIDLLYAPNTEIITYRSKGALACFQAFEKHGNQIYIQVNVSDYDTLGKSGINVVHPLQHFSGKPLHFLGASTGDRRLYDYKVRMCHGECWTFNQVCFNTQTKNKKELIQKIHDLYYTNVL